MQHNDLDDMLAMWRATKMLSPLLLLVLSGFGSFIVYYTREISKSLKHMSDVVVRHEQRFQTHEHRLDDHDERIDRIEESRHRHA